MELPRDSSSCGREDQTQPAGDRWCPDPGILGAEPLQGWGESPPGWAEITVVWAPGLALPAIYLEDCPGANCPTALNANFLNRKWNCWCFWPSLFPGAESKMRESNCLHCRELRGMAGLLCGRLESHPLHVQPLLSYPAPPLQRVGHLAPATRDPISCQTKCLDVSSVYRSRRD